MNQNSMNMLRHIKFIHIQKCGKYKNKDCRFNYGRFFSAKKILAKPLPRSVDLTEKIKL